MHFEWIGRAFIPAAIGLAFAIFKKYSPAKRNPALARYDLPEGKRLPIGIATTIMLALGVIIAVGGYFILLKTNRLFARADGLALMQLYPSTVIWCFLPGFAALAMPWPLTIFILRKVGYDTDADYIVDEANLRSGFDCYRVLVAMNLFIVIPIALFTLPALPMRMTLTENEIRVTDYARIRPKIFLYKEARRAFMVEGYLSRDGSLQRHRDLLIDFADGRRLNANAVGDGGTEPGDDEINLLLTKTGLRPQNIRTVEEIP